MSEEMAMTDNASGDDAKLNSEETATEGVVETEVAPAEPQVESVETSAKEESDSIPSDDVLMTLQSDDQIEAKEEEQEEVVPEQEPALIEQMDSATEEAVHKEPIDSDPVDEKRGIKRRASTAFSENADQDFKGFDSSHAGDLSEYNRVLERLEAEVSAASKDFTPVRNVMATPATVRASKRARQDTDGSRPSSGLSSRSDDLLTEISVSPASARGRRATTEMSSPQLRVPLERGWKRELVYRAALDAHSRRNADIYYYTPQNKKLRSTREVAEHLHGTGLTLDNFSFFKEPLGVDDPEKEIIRDAKLMRRVESPVSTPAPPPTEGKRTPKPKPPKGASPEPATPKSPPAKIKVKSVGSRLSSNGPPTPGTTPAKTAKKPAPAADNNNTAAWKKPSCVAARPPTAPAPVASTAATTVASTAVTTVASTASTTVAGAPLPPPLQSRPPVVTSPDGQERCMSSRQVVQPCSLTCGRGVPSLACAACLCLYHPVCAGHSDGSQPFYCKNCRKSTSPPSDPPPLMHKSGITTSSTPRRIPVPVPVPVPIPISKGTRPEKRVMLRMKAASGGAEGERVWAVAPQQATRTVAGGALLPQTLVRLNGRRFILVPRALVQPHHSITIDE